MSKEQLHYNLYSYFTLNDFEEVKQILLNHYENIDTIYENGVFFELAILKDQPDILKTLLHYTNDKNIDLTKITNILEAAIDDIDLSPEMQEILRPYINFDNSFEDRQNDSFLKDIDLPIERENGEVFDQKIYNNTFLTESVLKSLEGKDSPTYTVSTHDDYNHTNNHAEEHEVNLSGEHVS